MRRSAVLTSLLLVQLGLSLTRSASAQTIPSVDVRTWRPSTDPHAGMILEPATTPGPWNWNVGAWLNYTHHPVTLRHAGTDNVALRPVSSIFGADLVAGLGLGSRAAVGIDLPMYLYQDGSNGLPRTVSSSSNVPNSGVGDISFAGKGSIISNETGGFGLAALGNLSLPTGERTSFMGDGSARVGARLLAEYTLLIAGVQGSVGYDARTDHHVWPDASVGGITFGDEIPWTFGVQLRPGVFRLDKENRHIWELGLHGSLPAGPVGLFGAGQPGSAALSPVLLTASDRMALGHDRDTHLLAGVDLGLNGAVGVPTFRFVLGLGWAPREHDMDHDGVPDDVDQCPEIPEDRDGFEDEDGCPDIDNDNDGIIDKEDFCPNVAGVAQPGNKNGCPVSDSDSDGVADDVDACPQAKGIKTDNPKTNGCPASDRDKDGIADHLDKCPDQPEDKDGFEDEDGCPDPDNDGDGIPDKLDACPMVAGEPSTDATRNGCPNPDRDGDTFLNAADQCPDVAEIFNGVSDEDGCPDEGGKPLVIIDPKDPRLGIKFATPIKFIGTAEAPLVDPRSMTTLRALAQELNRHRDWTLAVGAKPDVKEAPAAAQKSALAKAVLLVGTMTELTHRDGAAEAVGWDAVRKQPGAEANGVGFMVMVAPPQPAAEPLTAKPAATPTTAPKK
jgi:OOP family OmpA-OmpF porin